MLSIKSFRRAQAMLAGIELIHMLRKEQFRHPAGGHLSPADQFYLLAALKIGNSTFADLLSLMRQNQMTDRRSCYLNPIYSTKPPSDKLIKKPTSRFTPLGLPGKQVIILGAYKFN